MSRTAVLICLWTTQRSKVARVRTSKHPAPNKRTVKVGHGAVILVLDQQVRKVDLGAVHVLSSNDELQVPSPLTESLSKNVADLRRKSRFYMWHPRLQEVLQ